MIDESVIYDTYTEPSDYMLIKGISLSDELGGYGTDDSSNEPQRFIFRVEKKILAYLKKNYDFSEDMITDDNQDDFVIAVCDQIEKELMEGINAPISEEAKDKLYNLGFMNLRRW